MSVLAGGHDDPNRFVVDVHEKSVRAILDLLDGLLLREFPACHIGINTAYGLYSFMGIWSVGLIYAPNLMDGRHDCTNYDK